MKREPKFRVGQVVYAHDWKGAGRLAKVLEVHANDYGEYQYMVEWSQTERLCAGNKELRALTKRERGAVAGK